MKKRIKAPALIVIAVLTVITIVFWIGFEVFRLVTKKPDQPLPAAIIAPLSPTLDTTALANLEKRVYLNEEEIGNIIIETKIEQVVDQDNQPENTPLPDASAEASVNEDEENNNP